MTTMRDPRRNGEPDGVLRACWVRLSRRAWSRAGAISAVVRTGVTRRVLSTSSRVLLLVTGCLLISGAVSVTLWNELGPGPLDVFIGAVRSRTGLPLSVTVWLTVGSMIGASWLMGRRPGPGTIAGPFLIGAMLETVLAGLSTFEPPSSMVVRIALHLLAIAVIGVGAGAVIVAGLGAGSGELFAGAASDRLHHPESRVRPAIEMSWLVVGAALGGPIGVGTLLVAAFIGPAVAGGYRLADGVAARSISGLQHTHEAIVNRELAALARENELIGR